MSWYKFNSEEDFNIWHQSIKNRLGYPFLSKDLNGNECEPLNTEYTSVEFINDEFKVWVDEQYAESLVQTDAPIYPKSI